MGKNQGFTLIEILIVLIVIGIMAAIALPQYFKLQSEAEKTSVQAMVASLQSAASITFAHSVVSGQIKIEKNPFEALSNIPASYDGIREVAQPKPAKSGRWIYDPYRQWLVYRPLNTVSGGYQFGDYTYVVYSVEAVLDGQDTVGVNLTTPPAYVFYW